LDAGADIIMLDNMSLMQMKKAVELIAGRALTEHPATWGKETFSR
jgi:nicotinate-nucleotide pyrophosphorylase (carboxylating)